VLYSPLVAVKYQLVRFGLGLGGMLLSNMILTF